MNHYFLDQLRSGQSRALNFSIILIVGIAGLASAILIPFISPLWVVGGVVAVMVAIVGWLNPRISLILLMISVSCIYWFTTDLKLFPDSVKFVKEALIALLFTRAFITLLAGEKVVRTPFDKWLMAFIVLALLSGLVNAVSPLVIAVALRGLFQYALVFYSIIWLRREFSPRFIRFAVFLAIGLTLVQFLVGMWQLLSEVQRGKLTGAGDSFRGMLGAFGSNVLGLFVLPFLFYLLSRVIDSREWTRGNLIGIVILGLIPVISSSRMAWLCFAIGLGLLWTHKIVRSMRALVFLAAFGVIAAVALSWSLTKLSQVDPRLPDTISKLVRWEGVVGSFTTPGYGVGLTAWANVAYQTVLVKAPFPLLGMGPGSGGSSAAVQLQTEPYLRYFYNYFGTAERNLPADMPTQFLQTSVEYGPFGFLILMIILFKFFQIAMRIRRIKENPHLVALGAALMIQTVVMAIVSFKDGVWEQQTVSMWLWLLGGFAFIELRRNWSSRKNVMQ